MNVSTITQCILQGICSCITYNQTTTDVCFGPVPSYQQFLTKTDYRVAIHGYVAEAATPLTVPEGCKPDLFYMFQRHTTRHLSVWSMNASSKYLPTFQAKLSNHRNVSKMCADDIQAILDWKPVFGLDVESAVSESGRVVVQEQVGRLRQRFPTVFATREPLRNMIVDFTDKGTRTKETAEVFLREWFGNEAFNTTISKNLTTVNELNTFHDRCAAIMKKHGINVTLPAHDVLRQSEICKAFKSSLDSRVGFELTELEMRTVAVQCRAEVALGGKSPWCAVFSEEDHRLLELLADVEHYYYDGYGTPRNKMMPCPLAQDLLHHLRGLNASDSELPKVVLHFSHAGALTKVATFFGLGRTSENDCSKRGWRTSVFSPFNTNLNVVRYTCPSGQESRVAVLFNEKIHQLAGCHEALCTAKEFEQILKAKADKCDFDKICSA